MALKAAPSGGLPHARGGQRGQQGLEEQGAVVATEREGEKEKKIIVKENKFQHNSLSLLDFFLLSCTSLFEYNVNS